MSFVPHRFLFRVAYSCLYHQAMPDDGDEILDLPISCRIENYADLDGVNNFADVRVAWNASGLGVQVEVKGKEKPVVAGVDRLRFSDQFVLWIDTRDGRTSHRASRTCHQFHFLPTGGGPDKDEPAIVQSRINRAAQDAPMADEGAILFQCRQTAHGYTMRIFLTASALNGFDPEQFSRWGIHYVVRDNELGEQTLSVGSDFPYTDDPSLWSVLELKQTEKKAKPTGRKPVEEE